jgi:hypothetical protein
MPRGSAEDPLERPSLHETVAIAVVLTAGLFLRLIFFTGPLGSDDTRYLEFAEHFVRLQPFSELDHAAGRLVFLVLVGIPYVLGGHATHAALANVGFGFVTDLLVTVVAFRAFGTRGALVVALLTAFNGIHLVYTSAVLPDTLLTLFMVLSVLAVLRARDAATEGRRLLVLAGAGALAGLAYGCKETGVLLLPPIAAWLFLWPQDAGVRARILPPAVFLGAFAAVWVVDGLVYLVFTGDFLYKITATAAKHNLGRPESGGLGDHLRTTFGYLSMGARTWHFTWVPLFLGLPAMVGVALLDRRHRLFALVGLFVLLFLIFGTSSLSRLVALPFQARYLQPVIPFAVISVAALLHRWPAMDRVPAGLGVAAALGALTLVAGLGGGSRMAGHMYQSGTYAQMALAVQVLPDPDRTLFVDARTRRDLPHFLPRNFEVAIETVPAAGALPRGYYLVHPEARFRAGVSQERQAEIAALPVQLQLTLDARPIRRLRPNASLRPLPRLTVHRLEHAAEVTPAEPPRAQLEGTTEAR